jgi:hypothetical protein
MIRLIRGSDTHTGPQTTRTIWVNTHAPISITGNGERHEAAPQHSFALVRLVAAMGTHSTVASKFPYESFLGVFGVRRFVFDKVDQPAQIHKSCSAQHERGLIETGKEVRKKKNEFVAQNFGVDASEVLFVTSELKQNQNRRCFVTATGEQDRTFVCIGVNGKGIVKEFRRTTNRRLWEPYTTHCLVEHDALV